MTERKRNAVAALALWVLAAGTYLPSLRGEFLNWDDDIYVQTNPAVTSPDGLRRIWSTVELPVDFPNYPLVFTSYWLEYRIAGANPSVFHATNAVLHGLNAVLTYRLILALGATPFVAIGTAALFAVHPVQVESVAWISERKNLLSAAFGLLAFLAFLRFRQRPSAGRWGAVMLAFAAALLSKTTAVVLPLSMLAAGLFSDRRRRASDAAVIVPMLAMATGAGLLTLLVEQHPGSVALPDLPFLVAASFWFYVGKLLVPIHLVPIYPRWEITWSNPLWWSPLLGLIPLGVLVRRWASDWRVHWGLCHFVVCVLPVLGVRPYAYNTLSWVADRNVYLACIGIFVVVVTAADWARRFAPRVVYPLAGAVLVGLVALTSTQIATWRDSIALWTTVLARNPTVAVAYNNLGSTLIDHGHLRQAEGFLASALAHMPDYASPYNNLALIAFRRGDLEAAETNARRAVALAPDSGTFRKNLALVLRDRGQPDRAEAVLREVPESHLDAAGHYLLGHFAAGRQQYDEAIAEFHEALTLDPTFTDARNDLGRVFLAQGRYAEAVEQFDAVIRRDPKAVEIRYNLSLALDGLGRRAEAIAQLEAVRQLRPDFEPARERLQALRSP